MNDTAAAMPTSPSWPPAIAAARAPCPTCAATSVIVAGAGAAACSSCRAKFFAVPTVMLALAAVDRTRLEAATLGDGLREKPCTVCAAQMVTLPLVDELTHVCVACNAVWCSKPAYTRLRRLAIAQHGSAVQAPPAPSPLPSMAARPPSAARPAPPARAVSATLPPVGQTSSSVGGVPTAATLSRAAASRETSATRRKSAPSTDRQTPATATSKALIVLVAAAAVTCAAGLHALTSKRTHVGGGATVSFGEARVTTEDVPFNGASVVRFVADDHGSRYAAVFLPGFGLSRKDPGDVLPALLGPEVQGQARDLGGVRVLAGSYGGRDAPQRGTFRAFFTETHAWVLSVASSDFRERSADDAQRFLSSLRRDD